MFYELAWFIESFLGYLFQLWILGENTDCKTLHCCIF